MKLYCVIELLVGLGGWFEGFIVVDILDGLCMLYRLEL